MEDEGIAISREQFLSSFGQRNDSIIPRWLGAASTPERIEKIADTKRNIFVAWFAGKASPTTTWVASWSSTLQKQGWLQAIASAAPRANVEAVLEALAVASFFGIVSAEDVVRGKPDPEVYLTAASRIGVSPDRCIVVEDAAAGIEGALPGGYEECRGRSQRRGFGC